MWLPPRHPPTLAALPWLVRKTCPGERPQLGDHCITVPPTMGMSWDTSWDMYTYYIYI
jgi:hypothetical protein